MTDRVIDLTDRLGPRSAEPSELTEPTAELGRLLSAAIEALLLIADEPMSAEDLGVALQRPVDEITETVEALQSGYATAGRGFTIRRESGGWRFVTSADCSELVSRFTSRTDSRPGCRRRP